MYYEADSNANNKCLSINKQIYAAIKHKKHNLNTYFAKDGVSGIIYRCQAESRKVLKSYRPIKQIIRVMKLKNVVWTVYVAPLRYETCIKDFSRKNRRKRQSWQS
jgi:hypothetical protein